MNNPSRNYNINRPIDEQTKNFEKELQELLDKYDYTYMDTETFPED